MTILVTGGAGFIGSNLVASLNERRRDDIVICDSHLLEGQWQNLVKHRFVRLVIADHTEDWNLAEDVTHVVHLSAVTDTQRTDSKKMIFENYENSRLWLEWCQERQIPFIYASSAAVYGDGSKGFDAASDDYVPLNLYGWSKLLFDRHVRTIQATSQVVGLRFFNVYGPNEYHKGKMASLVAQNYGRGQKGNPFRLFVEPPEIKRDFVYVEDAVNVILWLLDHPETSGICNVGSGQARTMVDLMAAVNGGRLGTVIERQPMPSTAVGGYQFYTQADLANLRGAGCDVPFRSIEEGIKHYVENYLSKPDRYR